MKSWIRTSGTSSARYMPAVLALDSLQCTVQYHTLLIKSDHWGNGQSQAQSFRDEVIQVFLWAMNVKADGGICENVCHLWTCDHLITSNWLALWNKMLTQYSLLSMAKKPRSTRPLWCACWRGGGGCQVGSVVQEASNDLEWSCLQHAECYLMEPGPQTPLQEPRHLPSHCSRSPPPSWRCPHRHRKTKTRKE